mmetsp:Transcript_74924/g.139837  ORF Transcript_74924/g.139837 Transcript_74924/m.139837 type:complete len:83 (+) Transcript_74924:215-463(+)
MVPVATLSISDGSVVVLEYGAREPVVVAQGHNVVVVVEAVLTVVVLKFAALMFNEDSAAGAGPGAGAGAKVVVVVSVVVSCF